MAESRSPTRIAAMLAVHNRRERTLVALRSLCTGLDPYVKVIPCLADDGSDDGTADAVLAEFPGARIVRGSGHLYWAAAMSLAENEAQRLKPDYYLWLNDDVVLDSNALGALVSQSIGNPNAVIVGAMRSPVTGNISYGGRIRLGAHPLRYAPLRESSVCQRMDTFEGNCVLVPALVRERVGDIDGAFPHAYADNDYGLRAIAKGFAVIQAPGTVGVCAPNARVERPATIKEAWSYLQSPKGLPWRAQVRFLRRHGDWRWPLWVIGGQIKYTLLRRVP